MLRKDFFCLVKNSLEAIDPSKLIRNVIKIENKPFDKQDYLTLTDSHPASNNHNSVKKREFLLKKNLYVVAFGKAALGIF
jgi:hypothetical protein